MNKLVLATGSNLGESLQTLLDVKEKLIEKFGDCEESHIYKSAAVDYLDQPDFLNQVLAFDIPTQQPTEVMNILLKIEKDFGRRRDIARGPRTVDIDIIFFGELSLNTEQLSLPHPRFLQRSFVVKPLLELSLASWVKENFHIPEHFDTDATPIS